MNFGPPPESDTIADVLIEFSAIPLAGTEHRGLAIIELLLGIEVFDGGHILRERTGIGQPLDPVEGLGQLRIGECLLTVEDGRDVISPAITR